MSDTFFDRLVNLWQTLFDCLDQLLCVVLFGLPYVCGFALRPSADTTISARVGKNAVRGKRWALIAERVINFFAGPGHCRHAISTDDSD